MELRPKNNYLIRVNKNKYKEPTLEEGINNISESISKYELRENSILYKKLIEAIEERGRSHDSLGRKIVATDRNNKQPSLTVKIPNLNINTMQVKKYKKIMINQTTRHKRCSKWLEDPNKDSLKFVQNLTNEKNIENNRKVILSINNYNDKLNNKENNHTFLSENNYYLTEPIIQYDVNFNKKNNYNHFCNGYKTDNKIQNYFYINNELYNRNYSNKSYDNFSKRENIDKKYDVKQSYTPDRYIFERKRYNNNTNKISLAKTFILYIEKICRVYLLKSMYKFFFYIKNFSYKDKNIFIFSKTNINKRNIFNNSISSLKGVKYNKRQNLIMHKIKDKLISISPKYSQKSELYRNYQELSKSNEKINRRKKNKQDKNNAFKNIKLSNYIKWAKNKLLDNDNNLSKIKKIPLRKNKIVLMKRILDINGKYNIYMKFMDYNKNESKNKKNKIFKKLEICKEISYRVKGKIKNSILIKNGSEAKNKKRKNFKLDAIKEEEEINK